MIDSLQKFMFENCNARGELVELKHTWHDVLKNHDYPTPVRNLLGEMLAAATLLSANLKFDGTLIMQIHGDGPVRLCVVECKANLQMRATAKLAPDAIIPDNISLTELVHAHGNGRFVITLDPNNKVPGQQAYQGIVPLTGDNFAAIIENYMVRSEQLDTKLWLAADQHVVRGMLLQKLPNIGGNVVTVDEDAEHWNHLVMLGNTLKTEELLSTDSATLLHRLFWEETVRVFEPQAPSFHCNCSREKVGDMLKMLGQAEVDDAIKELGNIEVNCDFCAQAYRFDAVDCSQLFTAETIVDAVITPSQSKH